jgi:hypothetical protein
MFLPTSGEAIKYCIENSIKSKFLKKKIGACCLYG